MKYCHSIRPTEKEGVLKWLLLEVINENSYRPTNPDFIKNSKLKHNCIHKGKCPHRGYDLSQVAEDNEGIVTCPLHGLKFKNNELL